MQHTLPLCGKPTSIAAHSCILKMNSARKTLQAQFSTTSWGRDVEREVLSSSPCMATAQSCTMVGSNWAPEKISSAWGWSDPGMGCLKRQLMSQACQCSRGIQIMPSVIHFNFWSALKKSGSWTSWYLKVSSNYSILYYSVLLCSSLLYFILFYSITLWCYYCKAKMLSLDFTVKDFQSWS